MGYKRPDALSREREDMLSIVWLLDFRGALVSSVSLMETKYNLAKGEMLSKRVKGVSIFRFENRTVSPKRRKTSTIRRVTQ